MPFKSKIKPGEKPKGQHKHGSTTYRFSPVARTEIEEKAEAYGITRRELIERAVHAYPLPKPPAQKFLGKSPEGA